MFGIFDCWDEIITNSLEKNKIGNVGAIAFAECLTGNTSLECFRFVNCLKLWILMKLIGNSLAENVGITDKSFDALKKMILSSHITNPQARDGR